MESLSSAVESVGEATATRARVRFASFDDFYRNEYGRVVGLAYVLTGERTRAEDLAQEGFAAAHRAWDQVGGYDNPAGFVRRVVANRSVSLFRRHRAERHALARLRASDAREPALSVESEQLWAEVRALPRRQTQVVALVCIYGLSLAEAGEVLGVSEGTARTHWRRARQRLAQRLSIVEGTGYDA